MNGGMLQIEGQRNIGGGGRIGTEEELGGGGGGVVRTDASVIRTEF